MIMYHTTLKNTLFCYGDKNALEWEEAKIRDNV